MSENVPPPKFDSQNYARPNEGFICGRAVTGEPCPLGPDQRGHCQATAECVPSLETLPGETKGRWRCNRSGGVCESGPLPNGSCGRPIPKCAPVPTLRTVRARINRGVIAFTCAALLILFGIPQARRQFINPGALSSAHSSSQFALPLGRTNNQSCRACHEVGDSGPHGILTAALIAEPRPWQIGKFSKIEIGAPTRMDAACLKCHAAHDFHQANTMREVSCAFCHREHQGAGRIAAVTDAQCGLCHGDSAIMTAAASKKTASGFTRVIHSFATDHPEFRAVSSNLRDSNTLKFNHRLHLTGTTIPLLGKAQKLDCAFCHQPDTTGNLMRPVRFENHCRVCHSLQFDPETPELTLPHGNADFVSAFLHSLPQQYSELARRRGITDTEQRKKFAEEKLAGLRVQLQPGEDFERRIFFSSASAGPAIKTGGVEGATRVLYPGCAYCHEVKAGVSRVAEISRPTLPERWLAHAHFDHAKHLKIACAQCHAAEQSRDTADVLLPAKASCVTCHSPQGGVADSCATCHTYHKPSGVRL